MGGRNSNTQPSQIPGPLAVIFRQMQSFDRNNFKTFAENNELSVRKIWFHNHSEIVKNRNFNWEHKSSFRSVSDTELNETYSLVGSLRDKKIKILDYIECNDKPDDFWNPESKIATNFYPYNSCDIYSCKKCKMLFLVYTEYGGHGPDQRIRIVKPELILEEPSNCSLKISNENISRLLSYLKLTKAEFEKMLEDNNDIKRVDSNFDTEKIVVKRKYEDSFLFISKRSTIYELIEQFE